ncbi:MAG: DUF805 domain-containing protein [Proteobacteria bacterium]|nr:DUF805 domain-containing protein [Pseudomonadota bacterium]
MNFQTLFLSASGRIGRQSFWIAFLILFVANMILGAIIGAMGQNNLANLLRLVVNLVFCYFWVCVYSKRLHDMGKSGWLQLVVWAVWIVALVAAVVLGGAAFMAAMSGGAGAGNGAALAAMGSVMLPLALAGLVSLGFLIWVGVTPSQPGDNAYGPSPTREPAAA